MKNIPLVQRHGVHICSVHPLDIQPISVWIFDTAARKTLLIGTEQNRGNPCNKQQYKHDQVKLVVIRPKNKSNNAENST